VHADEQAAATATSSSSSSASASASSSASSARSPAGLLNTGKPGTAEFLSIGILFISLYLLTHLLNWLMGFRFSETERERLIRLGVLTPFQQLPQKGQLDEDDDGDFEDGELVEPAAPASTTSASSVLSSTSSSSSSLSSPSTIREPFPQSTSSLQSLGSAATPRPVAAPADRRDDDDDEEDEGLVPRAATSVATEK
jgi:hypothetical protein